MMQLVQDSTRLARLWADVLRGTYPPFDFGVEIVWEAGLEVAENRRGCGLGRALAQSARFFIPPGEGIFMQVAAGNVASLCAILAAGFAPVGAEVLFGARE